MKLRHFRYWAQALALAANFLCTQLALAATALPSDIPFKANTPSDDTLVYRAVAAFLLACLAAYGIAWCVKRYLPTFGKITGNHKQLERLEAMRLSQRSMLIRVRWGDEELLIGENEHGVSLIAKRPFPTSHDATNVAQTGEIDVTSECGGVQKETHE